MVNSLICVLSSEYKEYFETVPRNTIFVLGQVIAKEVWAREISPNSSSYFNLTDDCWVVRQPNNSIGRWLEAYNNDDNKYLEEVLRNTIDWSDDTSVRFYARNKVIFQTRWEVFLRFWDDFLAVEDDCPIVTTKNNTLKQALLFRPIGDVLKIG